MLELLISGRGFAPKWLEDGGGITGRAEIAGAVGGERLAAALTLQFIRGVGKSMVLARPAAGGFREDTVWLTR